MGTNGQKRIYYSEILRLKSGTGIFTGRTTRECTSLGYDECLITYNRTRQNSIVCIRVFKSSAVSIKVNNEAVTDVERSDEKI